MSDSRVSPAQHPDAARRARPTWIRHGAAVVALLLYLAPLVFLPDFHLTLWRSDGGTTLGLGRGSYLIISGLIFLPFLKRVSYRPVDVLLLLFVPIWQFVVAWRVGWRLAFLPYRDWQPRPDEADRVVPVDDAGTYVLEPLA